METKNLESTSNVHHPSHYQGGKYECIEVMKEIFGVEALKTWIRLNIFKYSWRADKKNHDEDIAKIAWYSDYYNKLIKEENSKNSISESVARRAAEAERLMSEELD